jgi:hypothetical protein
MIAQVTAQAGLLPCPLYRESAALHEGENPGQEYFLVLHHLGSRLILRTTLHDHSR